MTPWFKDDKSGVDHGLCTWCSSDEREKNAGEAAYERWCRGCWCAPCMAGQTQAMLAGEPGGPEAGCCVSRGDPGLCACKSACYGWVIAQGIVVYLDMITFGAASACVPAVVAGYWQTGEVRKARDKKPRSCPTCCCDFLCGYFCGCCINIKNYRDTKAVRHHNGEVPLLQDPAHAQTVAMPPVFTQPQPVTREQPNDLLY